MVTKAKELRNMVVSSRVGTMLIWLGVLVWAPFIYLRVIGEKPAFLWFLPFHLIGVVGGSRMRAVVRNQLGHEQPSKNGLHKMGHALIFLGILVWLPYAYLKVAGQAAEVMDFLPFHLVGVLGGVFLHILGYVTGRAGRG